MARRFAAVAPAVVFVVSAGVFALAKLQGQDALSTGEGARTCTCLDGSGPEPRPPYAPYCMEFIYQQCTKDSDCHC